jgi:predicted transcriptional regulator
MNALFEQLIVKEKIEKGLLQIENGQTVTHADVIAHFNKKWLK